MIWTDVGPSTTADCLVSFCTCSFSAKPNRPNEHRYTFGLPYHSTLGADTCSPLVRIRFLDLPRRIRDISCDQTTSRQRARSVARSASNCRIRSPSTTKFRSRSASAFRSSCSLPHTQMTHSTTPSAFVKTTGPYIISPASTPPPKHSDPHLPRKIRT